MNQSKLNGIVSGLLLVVLIVACQIAYDGLKSRYFEDDHRLPVSVVVVSPDSWIDTTKAQTEEELNAQFARARQGAELARDAGYVVLYPEAAFLVPDAAKLTPEFVTRLEVQ